MKKISIFMALVMLVCFIPSITSRADSGFMMHTSDSVDGYFSDSSLNTMCKNIYCGSDSFTNDLYNAFNSLDLSQLSSEGNYSVLLYGYVTGQFRPQAVIINTDYVTGYHFVCTDNVSSGLGTHFILQLEYNRPSSGYVVLGKTISYTNNAWSYTGAGFTFFYGYSDGSLCNEKLGSSSYPFFLCDAKCPVYANTDIVAKGGSAFSNTSNMSNIDFSNYTNFNPEDLPYINSEGVIVTPSGDVEFESNENHMYFKNCEIGFCYPTTSPSPSSFGGAYFYIKYQVDDWVVSHISDYSLVFYADCEVGEDLTNTIRYEIALDPDGCITIPFSRLWTNNLASYGYSVLVTDREIEDNFNKAYLYSLSSSSFVSFGDRYAKYSGDSSVSSALGALISGNIPAFLYSIKNIDDVEVYTNSSVVDNVSAVKFNPYLIDAFCLLTDGTNESGLFEMEFDLVAGTEDVTDTSGMVNPRPFIPEDTSDPDYTPTVPSDGNSTIPSVIVNTGGTWQGIINGVISYDPGYTSLKNDINSDPNGNFTQFLTPFEATETSNWFLSFVDAMPLPMKNILVAGVGVGVLFGLYRFIRRG